MDVAEADNSEMFFMNAARQLVRVHDDKHAEWVLFRHGSLYLQTMPNNKETPSDELISKAKESLANVYVAPGTAYGDATVFRFNYENKENYYISIHSFPGIVLIHPSRQVTNDMMALIHGRENVLSDKENPIIIKTGNTKPS